METKALETLLVDVADNGVVTVTMNRPKKKNAVNAKMWDELRQTWSALANDPSVRCVIMTGAGDGFCSGADLGGGNEGSASEAEGEPPVRRHHLYEMNMIHQTVQALHSIMAPVIAKVCLLYTSPSPRDATLSRMPSSA